MSEMSPSRTLVRPGAPDFCVLSNSPSPVATVLSKDRTGRSRLRIHSPGAVSNAANRG
jgi:hypothetical protein